MKKCIVFILAMFFCFSMVFIGIGCKEEAATTEAAVATTEAAVATTEAAVATTEAATGKMPVDAKVFIDPINVPANAAEIDDEILIAFNVEKLDDSFKHTFAMMKVRAAQIMEQVPGLTVKVDAFSADNSLEKQIADVEACVTRGYDAILITAVDKVGTLVATDAAWDAGVKIIDFREDMETDKKILFHGFDETMHANTALGWYKDYLAANPEVVLKVGLLYGARAATGTYPRLEVPKEYAETSDQMDIVCEDFGEWQTDVSMGIIEDWLQAYPELNCIIGASDESTLGVVNVLKSADLLDKFIVTSYDGTSTGVRMVENGEIQATVGKLDSKFGGRLVDCAVAAALGQITDNTYNAVTGDFFTLLTIDNIEEWKALLEEEIYIATDVYGFEQNW